MYSVDKSIISNFVQPIRYFVYKSYYFSCTVTLYLLEKLGHHVLHVDIRYANRPECCKKSAPDVNIMLWSFGNLLL